MNLRRIKTIARMVIIDMLRRKDMYVLIILLGAFLFYLMSMGAFGLSRAVGHIKDVGLLLTWLLSWILAVTMAARQLSQEERTGTIYPLLAKPISRGELIVGKWLGVWCATVFATLLFYAVIVALVALRGGSFVPSTLLQGILLHCILLGMISAISLAISTRLNSDATIAITFVICLAAFAIVPRVPEFLVRETGATASAFMAMYYALPHFDLFDLRIRMVHNWESASWSTVASVALYGFFWIAIMLLLAFRAYSKRFFTRGEIR